MGPVPMDSPQALKFKKRGKKPPMASPNSIMRPLIGGHQRLSKRMFKERIARDILPQVLEELKMGGIPVMHCGIWEGVTLRRC